MRRSYKYSRNQIPAEANYVEIGRYSTVGTFTFTFEEDAIYGFFVVGGGASGMGDYNSAGWGGNGGNGGQAIAFQDIPVSANTEAVIVVGAGGAGGDSGANHAGGDSSVTINSISYTAQGGLRNSATSPVPNTKVEHSGCGGYPCRGNPLTEVEAGLIFSGKAGEGDPFPYNNVTRPNTFHSQGGDGLPNPFDENDANLYGAGGGAGANSYQYSTQQGYISGGTTGGGTGGGGSNNASTNKGSAATFFGAGGGGGAFSSNHGNSVGGAGYRGIVIIYKRIN